MDSPLYTIGLLDAACLTGIAWNLLVIYTHVNYPLKLIRSLSSCYILNINVVDLLLSSAPLFIAWSFTNSFCVPHTASSVTLLRYIVLFAMYLSLAIQRFCSVVFCSVVLWHCVNITTWVCRYWVAGVWLTYIVLVFGRIMLLSMTEMRADINYCSIDRPTLSPNIA